MTGIELALENRDSDDPHLTREKWTAMKTVSVVLPAYNEASCIGTLLDRINDSLGRLDISYTVVVVDDGSEDHTVDVVEQHATRMPIRILRHETNSGYGAALQTGLLEASRISDVAVTMDSDDSHDPELIPQMLKAIEGGHDVVIASRMQPGGEVVGVPFHRRLLSDAASIVLRVFLPMRGVRDFTSGYRAYRSTLLHSMVEEREGAPFVDEGGFVAGFAILLKAWNSGARVTEVPLRLRYDRKLSESRMRILDTARDYFRLLGTRSSYSRRRWVPDLRTRADTQKPDLTQSLGTVISDLASVLGAFAVAYGLHGSFFGAGWAVQPPPALLDFMTLGAIFALMCIAVFWRGHLYRAHAAVLDFSILQSTVRYFFQSAGLFLAVLFLAGVSTAPASLIGFGLGLSLPTVLLGRRLTWSAGRKWRKRKGRGRRVLIYGSGATGRLLLKKIARAPGMGARVVGFIDGLKPVGASIWCSMSHDARGGFSVPVLGRIRDLESLVAEYGVDELLVAIQLERSELMPELLKRCDELDIDIGFVPSVEGVRADQLRVEDLSAVTVLRPDFGGATKAYLLIKRMSDLAISVLLITAFFPVWALLMVLIRLDSPGPAIFRQTRVGERGKLFETFKFRTMHADSNPYARSPSTDSDPRITRVGKILRPSGLDEIPQLINILRGEMSLVGPRPEMPFIAKEYSRSERQRLQARPGITGLWQLSPDRGQEIHANMEYDLYYLRHRSLTLDGLILAETALFAVTSMARTVGSWLARAAGGSRRQVSTHAVDAGSLAAAAEVDDGYVFVAMDQRRRPDEPTSWDVGVTVSVALSRRWPVKLLVAQCNSSAIDGIVNQQLPGATDRTEEMPEYLEYVSNSAVRIAVESADVVLTDLPHVAAWARDKGAGLVRVDGSGATVEPNGGRPVPQGLLEELRSVVAVRDDLDILH
jgi:exopolysaccharide biosynthesis polyprenyl glycosylphosphotransferase